MNGRTARWPVFFVLVIVCIPVSVVSGQTWSPLPEPVADQPAVAGFVRTGVDANRIGVAQTGGRRRARGALIGGGIGLVAGGILGGLTVTSDDGGDGFGGSLAEGAATAEAVMLGAVVGAGLGAILGATVFAPKVRTSGTSDGALAVTVIPRFDATGPGVSVGMNWRP